jgi:hypothetical protein
VPVVALDKQEQGVESGDAKFLGDQPENEIVNSKDRKKNKSTYQRSNNNYVERGASACCFAVYFSPAACVRLNLLCARLEIHVPTDVSAFDAKERTQLTRSDPVVALLAHLGREGPRWRRVAARARASPIAAKKRPV